MHTIRHVVELILTSTAGTGIIGFLLIMVPTIGISIVHDRTETRKEERRKV